MLRRAFVLLLGSGLLAGCGGMAGGYYQPSGYGPGPIGLGQPLPPGEAASSAGRLPSCCR